MEPGQLDIHLQKRIIKLLKEIKRVNLCDLGLGKDS